MNLGIEATSVCAREHTGIGKYIVNQLRATSVLLAGREDVHARVLYRASRWRKREYAPDFPNLTRRWHVGKPLPLLGHFDLLHAMDRRLPPSSSRTMFTIYDMAIFLEEHQFEGYAKSRFRDKVWRQFQDLRERSRAIVTISQATKTDILKLMDFPSHRIHVIYPGLEERFARFDSGRDLDNSCLSRYRLKPRSYLLYVGSVIEKKNIPRIARAFLESKASDDYILVFAGRAEKLPQELREILAGDRARAAIRILGYVDDKDLLHLYAGAVALVYASLYEGFGLPILEAMSCKVPVVAGNRGAAPEVCAGHGILVDPFSVESIRTGIDAAMGVSSERLAQARSHAQSFSWEKSAREHLDLYDKVCAE